MERAVVLIGVRRSGGLPPLQAVTKGMDAMRDWAKAQDIPTERVTRLSDEDGFPVRTSDAYDAVRRYVSLHTIEQLVVYFCGHGVNNNGSEYWLLSDAPGNPNEAVNVALSMRLAERCGIPHVVLVSDACRTAPASIQADDVTGAAIFPNLPVGAVATSGDVDAFYACRLGEPAYEIADPTEASRSYRAVYTEVLAEALDGRYVELRERVTGANEMYDVVRPYPLRKALPDLVTRRIIALKAARTAVQVPESKVCSDPHVAWLSRLAIPREPPPDTDGPPSAPPPSSPQYPPPTATGTDGRRWWRAWRRDSFDVPIGSGEFNLVADAPDDPARVDAENSFNLLNQPPDLKRVDEGPAALRVRGSKFKDAQVVHGGVLAINKNAIRVDRASDTPVTVLIQLGSGHCALIPTFPGRLGTLTVGDGRLIDVSYVDLQSGWPGTDPDYRRFRSWIATTSRYGIFWDEGNNVEKLLEWHEHFGDADPSLDVYLAQVLADRGRHDLVDLLLNKDDGPALYDVALLANGQRSLPVVPPIPLLARNWALLAPSMAKRLPTPLPSHWTLFRGEKMHRIQKFLDEEGLQ